MRSIKNDIVVNVVLTGASVLGIVWMLWLASRTLAATALGLFLLVRRLADTCTHFMHLGAPVGLRRYLTIARDPADRSAHFIAAVLLGLGGMIVVMAILAVMPRFWANFLLGPAASDLHILAAVAFLSSALVTHYLAASALLARGHIVAANLTELFSAALAPIAALYWIPGIDALALLSVQIAAMGVTSITVLAMLGWRMRKEAGPHSSHLTKAHVIESATYGLPRAAGLALETSFLVIGPWLLREDLAAVAHLGIAFFLLRFARTVLQPVTILVAMKLGGLHSHGARSDVRRGLDFVIAGVLLSMAAVVPPIHAWSGLLLQLWLGPAMAAAIQPYASMLLLAVIPLSLLQALKEPIEMMWKTPFTLGLFAVGTLILIPAEYLLTPLVGTAKSVSGAYVIAYLLMCAGAWAILHVKLSEHRPLGVTRLIALAIASWLANFAIETGTQSMSLWVRTGIMMVAAGLSALGVFAFYLWVAPPALAREMRDYLLATRASSRTR